MNGYLDMGHIEIIPKVEILKKTVNEVIYLPHHPDIRGSSTTTHFRIVLGGSAKTVKNVSLTENLIVGPTV